MLFLPKTFGSKSEPFLDAVLKTTKEIAIHSDSVTSPHPGPGSAHAHESGNNLLKIATGLHRLWGTTSTSYMTLGAGTRLFLEEQGKAYIAYRVHLGVAISVGDPIGEPQAVENCIHQFINFCKGKGWLPIFFAIENNLPLYKELGFKNLQVAEDAYLELAGLNFKGKAWQDVRTALNRASREGLEFRRFEAGSTGREVLEQIEEISKHWLKSKKLPELGFMLGGIDTVYNPAIRTYYALDQTGQVQGFVTWLPCAKSKGWALDLMRSRQGAMPGIIDFLIASSALDFKAGGYHTMGLGAAPLAPVQAKRKLALPEKMLYGVKPWIDSMYDFSNLYNFKRKFQPAWKALYLYYYPLAGLGLVRALAAVLLAYLYKPKKMGKGKASK